VFQKKWKFNYGKTKKEISREFVKDIRKNKQGIFTTEEDI